MDWLYWYALSRYLVRRKLLQHLNLKKQIPQLFELLALNRLPLQNSI